MKVYEFKVLLEPDETGGYVQPRRIAKRQTWLSAIRASHAVLGAGACSLPCDHAATRSGVTSRSFVSPSGRRVGSAEASTCSRTTRSYRSQAGEHLGALLLAYPSENGINVALDSASTRVAASHGPPQEP